MNMLSNELEFANVKPLVEGSIVSAHAFERETENGSLKKWSVKFQTASGRIYPGFCTDWDKDITFKAGDAIVAQERSYETESGETRYTLDVMPA